MLGKRVLGAILYTAILAGGILLRLVHVRFFDGLIIIMTVIAAVEVASAFKNKYSQPNIVFLLIAIVVGYIGYLFFGLYMFFAGVVLTIAVLFISMLFNKKLDMQTVSSTIFTVIYPITLFAFLLQLNTICDSSKFLTAGLSDGNLEKGLFALLTVFIVSSFSDVGAYFIGSALGKKIPLKLCPNISPKKTVVGAAGGLLGGMIASMLMFLFCYFNVANLTLFPVPVWANVLLFLTLGLFGSFFTQCGDLVASLIKRSCGIKDFGNIIFGHGGIMDRVDGVLFNAVFVYGFLMVFNLFYHFL